MLANNFSKLAESLAKEKYSTFTITTEHGLTISGPASLLPSMVTDPAGGLVEKSITAGPVAIHIPPGRVVKFSYASSVPPEEAN